MLSIEGYRYTAYTLETADISKISPVVVEVSHPEREYHTHIDTISI